MPLEVKDDFESPSFFVKIIVPQFWMIQIHSKNSRLGEDPLVFRDFWTFRDTKNIIWLDLTNAWSGFFHHCLDHEFASWSCSPACEAKEASSHRWKRCYHWGGRAYRAWGAKHQWRMHVVIKCSKLHVWSRVVELDFRQDSFQTGPSVSCVPYFKACAAWKSATTRTWQSTGTGVSYLHTRQFACCLAFCQGIQC